MPYSSDLDGMNKAMELKQRITLQDDVPMLDMKHYFLFTFFFHISDRTPFKVPHITFRTSPLRNYTFYHVHFRLVQFK